MMIWLTVIIFGSHIILSLEQSTNSDIRLSNGTGRIPPKFELKLNSIHHSSSDLDNPENPDLHSLEHLQSRRKPSNEFQSPTSVRIARSSSFKTFGNFRKTESPLDFPSTFHSSFFTKQIDSSSDTSTDGSQNILSQMSVDGAPTHGIAPPYLGSFASQSDHVVPKMNNPAYGDSYVNMKKGASNLNLYPSGSASNVPIYSIHNQSPMETQKRDQIHNVVHFDHPGQSNFGHSNSPQVNSRAYTLLDHGNQQQLQFTPLSNFGLDSVDDTQYKTIPTFGMADKGLTLPVLQLQTATDFSGFMQNAASSPVLFDTETGLQYRLQPGFGASFDFANPKIKKKKPAINTPVQKPLTSAFTSAYPAQIPHNNVRSHKFDGSGANQGSVRIPNDYVEFSKQTQLHFNGAKNQNPESPREYIRQSKPFERPRSAEIINKKKPTPLLSNNSGGESDEAVSNEEFEGDDSYFPKQDDGEDTYIQKYFKEPKAETGFEPSKSYPFREYDEKFGEQNREHPVDDEGGEEDDRSKVVKYQNDQDGENDEDESEDATIERNPRHQKRLLQENFQDKCSIEDESDESYRPSKLQNSQRTDRNRKISKGYKKRAMNSGEGMSWRRRSKHKREQTPNFDESAHLGVRHRRKKPLPKSLKRNHRDIHQHKEKKLPKTTGNSRLLPPFKQEEDKINLSSPRLTSTQGSQVVWEDSFRVKKPFSHESPTRLHS